MGYQKEDNNEPFISAQCRKDVHHAQRFLNANQRLWNRAGEFFQALFPGKYKMIHYQKDCDDWQSPEWDVH